MTSASCAPTQAKLVDAGLENTWNTCVRGDRMKVLPQLAGPVMKTFLYFPLPLSSTSKTALWNVVDGMLFRCRMSPASLIQRPLHPGTQGCERNVVRISTRDCCFLFSAFSALRSSQATYRKEDTCLKGNYV